MYIGASAFSGSRKANATRLLATYIYIYGVGRGTAHHAGRAITARMHTEDTLTQHHES